MYSVFSTNFVERCENYIKATLAPRDKPLTITQAYDIWMDRKDLKYSRTCPTVFLSLHPEDKIFDNNIFNRICADTELRKVEQWVTNNILMKIKTDYDPRTVSVKLRIAAGMLNKLVDKSITDFDNVYVFNNLIRNVHGIRIDIVNDSLPF